ncbi:MAG TPA: polyprenol monophosphomannose synthase [Candidatus Alistipes avicola]|uniref:Polyprenol monophosphomannose synthase n=1 Tax=Candidatus Alistipes avicola TaxID=2838432 RepID=A0A9D2L251_9BACT|nr:polyprenol monophosphomannose synthase [uncultured Alistipes sp.]HJA98226.1 polyprenol monophosphomannose synthase [Candidatus Alistipes avicola]
MKKLVVIPTYEEIENISKMISKVMSLEGGYHLLVVDDGSPDGTATVVKERQAEFPDRLFLIERSGKLGLGTAYITAFRWALERDYDAVFEMDCDFSHNPDDLLRLAAELERGADVAVGSRYSQGVTVMNWPMSRLLMSYCASRYVKIVTGMPVNDATAGFVGYRREVLETMNLDRIEMVGYGFQIEMKYTAWKMGFTIAEVPIVFVDRTEGISKMSSGIFGEAFFGVLALPFRRIERKR